MRAARPVGPISERRTGDLSHDLEVLEGVLLLDEEALVLRVVGRPFDIAAREGDDRLAVLPHAEGDEFAAPLRVAAQEPCPTVPGCRAIGREARLDDVPAVLLGVCF